MGRRGAPVPRTGARSYDGQRLVSAVDPTLLCDRLRPTLLPGDPTIEALPPIAGGIVQALLAGAAAGCLLAQLGLALYGIHRWSLLALYARIRGVAPEPSRSASGEPPRASARGPRGPTPFVTVQLPLYNERHVVERLIDAACALDYPRDRFEVQVLDDSTDDTTRRARVRIALHRARGTAVVLIHRPVRAGFKAGALAAGLLRARGELVCVFDADFLPPPEFLRRMIPAFDDPRVGMVQARWGHLNRDYSFLTEAQALCLDGHFAIEHAARAGTGRFFNFNGTAGVWRRRAIEDAGGWTHDTLTEDLDLSYRAQMRGWKFVYRRDVVAPAELPIHIGAFKAQQRRWARGSFQTARKILPAVARARLPLAVKLEAFWHLTANASYLLLFVSIVLLGPVLALPARAPAGPLTAGLALLFAAGFAGVILFFAAARRALGETWRDGLARVPGALLLGVGLSLNNARAVAGAFLPRVGRFERTPKYGVRGRDHRLPERSYARRAGGEGVGEAAMAAYALGLGVLAAQRGRWEALPFLLLVVAGFALVAWLSVVPARAVRALEGSRRARAARVSRVPRVSRTPGAVRAQVRGLAADAVEPTPI